MIAKSQELRDFTVLMERILKTYSEYRDLLLKCRSSLVSNNLSEIQKNNSETERMSLQIQEYEKRRILFLDKLGGICGREIKNVRDMQGLFEPGILNPLLKISEDLKILLQEIKFVQKVNHGLIENSRKIIHGSVAIITSVAGKTKEEKFQVYGKSGRVAPPAQQIRQLVNRKG